LFPIPPFSHQFISHLSFHHQYIKCILLWGIDHTRRTSSDLAEPNWTKLGLAKNGFRWRGSNCYEALPLLTVKAIFGNSRRKNIWVLLYSWKVTQTCKKLQSQNHLLQTKFRMRMVKACISSIMLHIIQHFSNFAFSRKFLKIKILVAEGFKFSACQH
jgi:hypothetical protein